MYLYLLAFKIFVIWLRVLGAALKDAMLFSEEFPHWTQSVGNVLEDVMSATCLVTFRQRLKAHLF